MSHCTSTTNQESRNSFARQRHWVIASIATVTLFTGIGTLFPGTAVAAEAGGQVKAEQFHFSYKPSELQSEDRAKSLLARIFKAARNNCPNTNLVAFRVKRECQNAIAADLLEQIRSPLLDQLADGMPVKLATAK